ncbi:MAG: peptidyl-prolyl cis-trans isomerase [Burkholderiaceae bacterium]|nr:peptidyl-prolyl cis-trans isomerase [Burkholderiaceae bacterium]
MSSISLALALSLSALAVQAADQAAKAAQPAASRPAEASASPVLVEGKGVAITGLDVQADALRIPPDVRPMIIGRPANVQRMATDLFVLRSLAQTAQQQGMASDPKVMAALQVARDKVLAEAWMAAQDQKSRPSAEAAEKLARSQYQAQPERFKVDAQVRARHILIGGKDAEARAQADKVLADLKNGADFATLAQEKSSDKGSASRGGDLGFFGAGRMVPEFEKAAFALKQPGELSAVVESQFGFHIIQLEERRPAGVKPFDEVRDELVKEIQASATQNARVAAADKIRQDAKLNEAALEAFTAANKAQP